MNMIVVCHQSNSVRYPPWGVELNQYVRGPVHIAVEVIFRQSYHVCIDLKL